MGIIFYFLAWLSFALVHSILANPRIKSRLTKKMGGAYRLFYNVFSVIHIGLVYLLGLFLFQEIPSYNFPDIFVYFKLIVFISGFILLIWAARHYDLGLFSGFTQLRQSQKGLAIDEREDLNLSGMHKWVRHPLYSASFLILWGRVASPFDLYTAIFASLYLIIGSRFEERSLIKQYGQDYRDYIEKVPAFIPYKGPLKT